MSTADRHNRVLAAAEKRALELESRLVEILTPIFTEAGDEAATRFAHFASGPLLASVEQARRAQTDLLHLAALGRAAPDMVASLCLTAATTPGVTGSSTMVALKPRPDEAAALAGDIDPEEMHVTLAILPDTNVEDLEPLRRAVEQVATAHAPLEGNVGGVGLFGDNGKGHPAILLPSVPGLIELRVDVTEALVDAGFEFARNFGYQPHMTVAYGPPESLPDPEQAGHPLHFDSLLLVRGHETVGEFPLVGTKPITASLTASSEIVASSDTGKEIGAVAEQHSEGCLPDYGSCYWHEVDGKVLWIVADYTTNDQIEEGMAAFVEVDGVEDVEACDECGAPDGDGWERVYGPSQTELSLFVDGYMQAGKINALLASASWTPPVGDELVDVDALVSKLRTKTDPVRNAVVEATMTSTLAGAGLKWDVENPLTAHVLKQAGSQVKNIADTTRLNVMKIVDRSYKEGLSIPDTATAIRAGMADAAGTRATLIARTELAGAVNGGSLAATQIVADATGQGYDKQWLTAPGAVYPRHETYEGLDGQTTALDGVFQVGGDELQYPGDPAGSPEEVCNCRCTIVYLESGQMVDEQSADEAGPVSAEDLMAEAAVGGEGGGGDVGGLAPTGGDLPALAPVADDVAPLAPEAPETGRGALRRAVPEMPLTDAAAVSESRPFAHIKDVTLDTQIYRSKKEMRALLNKPSAEWTAKDNATYEKHRVKLAALNHEKLIRSAIPARPYAHYAEATLKTQIYRVNKRLEELKAEDETNGRLSVAQQDELARLHDKMRGLTAEKQARLKDGTMKPSKGRPTQTNVVREKVAATPAMPPPANERIARLRQVYEQRTNFFGRLVQARNSSDIEGIEAQITAAGAEVRAEVTSRLDAAYGSRTYGSPQMRTPGSGATPTQRRDMMLKVLSEIREMGAGRTTEVFNYTAGSDRSVASTIDHATRYYPRDWMNRATLQDPYAAGVPTKADMRPLTVTLEDRGYFQSYGGGVDRSTGRSAHKIALSNVYRGISGDPKNASVAVHELAHLMEQQVPGIRDAESAFYDRRCYGNELKQLYPNAARGTTMLQEVARPDEFVEAYIGKDYGAGGLSSLGEDSAYEMPEARNSFEVLSMGMESLFTNSYDVWGRDPDMTNVILGMLVSL